ncbi:hypothetical protein RB623_09725 [Mesorhizobium sp. LHD-90]|uniref:hypothetical protein n=1 Tax=Mesorhizobium sp. LHD-90 TaxID=3071414 RepID=UPI0027E1587D|nr:hypothetical protein [Mesorhizobium sp. LHD-90]MDQ6434327.1 hypothetical protein [Mesorhizobium sp. LHD-90]
MPLLSIWQSNPEAIDQFTIEQVVSSAGDGNLRDGSVCSSELVTFFSEVPSEKLAKYVQHCLGSKFEKGGMVLQDLVNELGRRLDYEVANGRYQGTSNSIGFDGLWKSPEGRTVVVEVKTSDAYRISLDTLSEYRQKLISSAVISENSSILIVVGRQDTGELEAQIRGSRHAWDIRLISAEALIKLVTLKEDSDEPETGSKIRSVLTPVEYTRLDGLVDVMFTTAKDIEQDLAAEVATDSKVEIREETRTESASITHGMTDSRQLQIKRDAIVAAMSSHLGDPLVKKSRALYQSANHEKRIACTISKRYAAGSTYWYAYHPKWDAFLKDGVEGFFVLGCMDLDLAFALPRNAVAEILDDLHVSETASGMYWHIHITERGKSRYELVIPRKQNIDLKRFEVSL